MTCQICKKQGHDALRCWHRFDNSYQHDYIPQGLIAVHISDPKDNEWHPDTGATAHITNDKGKLIYSYSYKGSDSVIVGSDATLPITHIGTGSIGCPNHLALNNVLVVPQITKNLLSVSQLTKDNQCFFEFNCHGFSIKDSRTG